VSLTEPPKKKRRLISVSENDNEDRSDQQMPSLAEDAENNLNIANLPEVGILNATENTSGTSSSSALNEPPVQPFPDTDYPTNRQDQVLMQLSTLTQKQLCLKCSL